MALLTGTDAIESSKASRKLKLRTIVRKSLLKEYGATPATEQRRPPIYQFATPVSHKMGMKDSDDYLTARAANPRTGLISPSLAGTPRTPESPAEALKIRSQRSRPALTRANEARKISAGGLQKWHAGQNGWSFEDTKSGIASPRPSDAGAGAAEIASHSNWPIHLKDDAFVVNMPSAREPQPYAFPGRSSQEIQAFEHYRRKARKTSGDGWDQRCVHSGGIRKSSGIEQERGRKRASVSSMPGQFPMRDGTIIRRRFPSLEVLDGTAVSGADVHYAAASFAPYSSPKTPAMKHNRARRSKTPRILDDYTNHGSRDIQTSPPITHLSQLPKLHLIHPELASLPMPKLRRNVPKPTRSCSLGCDREPDSDTCPQLITTSGHVRPLFDSAEDSPSFPVEHAKALAAYVFQALRAAHDKFGATVQIHIPKPAMVATLMSSDSSVGERIAASRALMTLVGQLMGVLMVLSVVWRLLDAIAGVVGLLLWPLVVPARLVWWVLAG